MLFLRRARGRKDTMISNRGMAEAAMASCAAAALLALTGCSAGGSGSPPKAGATVAAGMTAGAPTLPFGSGPAHTISTPARLGSWAINPSLQNALDISGMREQIMKSSTGHVSGLVSAVYTQGNVTPGAADSQQVFMFVGGHLANGDPAQSMASFERAYPHAQVIPAGALGGEAGCAATTAGNGSVAMCVWFDNDSFGTLVSPTMPTARLASTLGTVRPGIEKVA
jgi:hypothetical protein